MKKLGSFIVKFKFIVLAIFAILFATALGLSSLVKTNEDIFSYLPNDIESIEGAKIAQESFHSDRTLYILIKDSTKEKSSKIVQDILEIEINDIKAVSSMEIKNTSKNNDAYLYNLVIEEGINRDEVVSLSESINDVLEEHDVTGGAVSGTESLITNIDIASTLLITVLVISLVILVFTKSYFDVVIILGSVGVAIILNNGTNILFGNGISNITKSAASLIQLAVSVDYSLFIVNNFREQRQKGMNVDSAIAVSVKASSKSVLAGSITTIAGFLALMFMKFELGSELGLVLAKGIIISLIVSLTLVPALIKVTYKVSEKLEHKSFLPKFGFIVKNKKRSTSIVISLLLVFIALFSFISKSDMDYIYGEPAIGETSTYIKENFDVDNNLVFIFNKDEDVEKVNLFTKEITKLQSEKDGEIRTIVTKEFAIQVALTEKLEDTSNLITACSFAPDSLPAETKIMCESLPTITDPAQAETVSTGVITSQVIESFTSDTHELILISLNDPNNNKENEEIFNTIQDIRDISSDTFEKETHLTGTSVTFYDMKEMLVVDDKVVAIISIIAVGLVIIIAFKSISIPLLLLLGIQSAIWLNLALSNLLGGDLLMFMGVVMVSSMQLGASIDYSILLTEKYEYNRFKEEKPVYESILNAVENSSHSILTSGLALTISGTLMSFMQEGSLGQIGLLLGRGAFLSLIVSLFIFPHVLIITDKFIKKGTYGLNSK